ncbi:MAG TPA: molybdate ABC transporter substrate-binding protein [Thermomicrobiales bacterium]|nr:molybdate ABC transporter substrate-binding protein [Thermomicrobiales bacterium]
MMARVGIARQGGWALRHLVLAVVLASLWGGVPPATLSRAQGSISCSARPSPATPVATPPGDAPVEDPTHAPFPNEGGELTVFAAASLTDAFTEIKADLEADVPGLEITFNFGGSQALATQLAEGAEADVFAPADQARMQAAVEAGRIAGEPIPFASNRLAVVVPADNPAGIRTPADLAGEGVKLVLAQPEVPAGRYARQAICRMAEETAAHGEDFAGRVAANIVSQEEDVRGVLTRVQLGEADAGIVYVSDAVAAGDAVTTIEIPDNVNVVASYPTAEVAGGDHALAAAFIAYVLSPEGQATLGEYGFELDVRR